jgi:hypothetical protein
MLLTTPITPATRLTSSSMVRLSKTAYESGQCHNAIFYRDTNIGGDNVRIRYQLVLYVSFDVQV